MHDTLRCALTFFFPHNFRLFFFYNVFFYLFKLFNPKKWVISKHPYITHLWKRLWKETKRSTYDVISQLSLVAFVCFSLYTPVLRNCKWSKHKTYYDDRYLNNICLTCFILSTVTSGIHQKGSNKVVYNFNSFSRSVLVSLINTNMGLANVKKDNYLYFHWAILFVRFLFRDNKPCLHNISKTVKTATT